MTHPGFIGGRLGDVLLRRLGGDPRVNSYCDGSAYRERSKLEVLLGRGLWDLVRGMTVIDFGCGTGADAIELAQRGARIVIGLDIRSEVLEQAAVAAGRAGVSDRCRFVTRTDERADVIISMDGFEHFADPAGALAVMASLVKVDGRILISFGPPWFHPLGGHPFSIFPWAHLLFTEEALLRWRAAYVDDGATRFGEIGGGLNQMTVRRFRRLVRKSGLTVLQFEAVPIRRLRRFHNTLTRELFTASVRCTLCPGPVVAGYAGAER